MAHLLLTCTNHPELRWMTKEEAISTGRYTGARRLFFRGLESDNGFASVPECPCPTSDLRVLPDPDALKPIRLDSLPYAERQDVLADLFR